MKKPSGFTLAQCLCMCFLAKAPTALSGEYDAWKRTQGRLKQEALELFRVVLADDREKPATCEFRTKWLEYPVPAHYFGSKILADLVPIASADPAEIMDPSGTMPSAFCSEANDELRLSFIVESLKRKELRDEKDPTKRLNWFEISRREYTFPIFDKTYRRAVIVGSNVRRFWYWHPNGKFRLGIESALGASIFEKRNGRWRFIKFELFSTGHG
jgi:hypothetical protein